MECIKEERVMSMSDCEKCWNTPCMCGYEYRNWTRERRIKLASVVLGISLNTIPILMDGMIPKKHPMSDK
jgi:hypothetical protein